MNLQIVEKGKSLMKKRGSAATFAVTSDSNVLSVHFHSDDCTTAKGFAMSWSGKDGMKMHYICGSYYRAL